MTTRALWVAVAGLCLFILISQLSPGCGPGTDVGKEGVSSTSQAVTGEQTAPPPEVKGVSPDQWATEVAEYLERDQRIAHQPAETGAWVLNQPGMRWFVMDGIIAVVSHGVEVDEVDGIISVGAIDERWGFGYQLVGVSYSGADAVPTSPEAADGLDNQVVVSHESGLMKQFENLPEGIEQRLVIPEGPPGNLVIKGQWIGKNFAARLAGGEVMFSARGVDLVEVSAPLAYNAEINPLPARFVLADQALDIEVLGARSFPVLVAPV